MLRSITRFEFPLTVFLVLCLSLVSLFPGCLMDSDDSSNEGNLPTWKEGDSWSYTQTDIDLLSQTEEEKVVVLTVAGVDQSTWLIDDAYYVNSSYSSFESRFSTGRGEIIAMGNLSEAEMTWNGLSLFRDYDFPLEVGKHWGEPNVFVNFSGEYQVTKETIKVSAGTFECFKIHGDFNYVHGDWKEIVSRTIYYSPLVKREVKKQIEGELWIGDDMVRYGQERELLAYGFADTDGDGLADTVEEEVFGSDPKLPDSDGDGVEDAEDFMPSLDAYLKVTLAEFETGGNDATDNGASPTECDPYFVVDIFPHDSAQPFASIETEPSPDQDTVYDQSVVIDLPDSKEHEIWSSFGTYVFIYAWDDDSEDSTDSDGDDPVNINDDDDNYCCQNSAFFLSGVIWNVDDGDAVNEGEFLEDSGSDDNDGNARAGSIRYTFEVISKEEAELWDT